MMTRIPDIIADAITTGAWIDPGPIALRELLGLEFQLPDMVLFDLEMMCRVADQLEVAGYVQDPEFCMTQDRNRLPANSRLVVAESLFIAGSSVPGDDVFVAADLGSTPPSVLVFDWSRRPPNRWVLVATLDDFVERLSLKNEDTEPKAL